MQAVADPSVVAPAKPERYATRMTDQVARTLASARRRGHVTLLTGPYGVGLATAVDMAADDRPELRLRRVICPPADTVRTARAFFRHLAAALEVDARAEAGALELAAAVAAEVGRYGLLLTLVRGGRLRPAQLEWCDYLADLVPCLVLAGSDLLRDRVTADRALAARVRFALSVKPLGLDEVKRLFSDDFSDAYLESVHRDTGGLWSELATILDAERHRTDLASTRELGAADAQQAAGRLLLREVA